MEKTELYKQLTGIFKDIFDVEDIVLEEKTQATDIDEWDSLTHVMLVVAIEKQFKIRFSSKEIQSWKNVGELVHSINEKRK